MTEEQKINELLKPRYIVENIYPGCEFNPGDILVKIPYSNAFSLTDFESGMYAIPEDDLKKYPYLFRELQWWEERDASEMPEYVKPDPNGVLEHLRTEKTIYKVLEWVRGDDNLWCKVGNHDHIHVNHIIPATESEYTAYIEKQPTTQNQGV